MESVSKNQREPRRAEAEPPPHLSDFSERVRAAKLRLLYNQSYPTVFFGLATALLLSIILWSHLDNDLILGWLGAIFLVSAYRLSLFVAYRRIENDLSSYISWEKPYFAIVVISSLVWGVGCAWMISTTTALYQTIIYVFLVGTAGGAISVYSAVLILVRAIVAAVLLPATTWLLVQEKFTLVLLGVGGLFFLLNAIRGTGVLANALHRNILLNYQLAEAKEQAVASARTDFLTGLNNRRYFNELATLQVEFCRRHGYPVSLILLDVDEFKKVNDTRGHNCGDLALQHLAKVLLQSIRSPDVCGRIGGEEFAILVPNADLNDTKATAERIRSRIEQRTIDASEGPLRITVSLGITTGGFGVEELLKRADKAMYRAKTTGRNKVCQYGELADGG